MNVHTLSPIAAVEASQPGALDGFETRCTCGLVLRSSLRSLLEADAAAHARWHERQAARAETTDPQQHDGFEILARLLAASETREFARKLDRKGGGLTAHASAILRAKADRWDREASWLEAEPEVVS